MGIFTTIEPKVERLGRLDAAIFSEEYERKIQLLLNYEGGFDSPAGIGITVTPGPSLELKILGIRTDSDRPKPGFYTLILPTNISDYGTLNILQYVGTPKSLPLLRRGDVVMGEAGFHKGRSLVLIEAPENCTTNAHGLYARSRDEDLQKAIFFRCVFNWYRREGLVDLMAVGGSGGHLSPSYFDDFVMIPRFPEVSVARISRLYSHEAAPPNHAVTLDNLVEWHDAWNAELGIWQLQRERNRLADELTSVLDCIIAGEAVELPPHLSA